MKINKDTDALIVIDLQNDFCEGGKLAVSGGHSIALGIVELSQRFKHIVLSQDWHPEGHSSFASSHKGATPFSSIKMPYGEQTLWPDHCVQGTDGAEFLDAIKESNLLNRSQLIIRKGMNPSIDSYSAFFENDQVTPTGLSGYLKDKGIKRVFFVGLAYDFCVAYSALDAKKLGLESIVIKDLCKSIRQPLLENIFSNTEELMETRFKENGVNVLNQKDISLIVKSKKKAY